MTWELFWFALPRMALLIPAFYFAWRIATND
jgi:hypothetical protein